MANSNWEADKMLDVYIYDYLLKRNFQQSAKQFMSEGKVSPDPVAIDAPGGFLFEWWSVFWDIFISRTNEKHSDVASSYIETQQLKAREHQQNVQHQYLQQRQMPQQLRRDVSQGAANVVATENMLAQTTANALATKLYQERLQIPQQRDGESPTHLLDVNRAALLKASTNPAGALLQNNSNSMNAMAFQQARQLNAQEMKNDAMLLNQRSPITDQSIFGVGGALQAKTNLLNQGINQGAGSLSMKGWPLTTQGQKPLMHSSQFNLLSPQQQHQILMQAQQQNHNNITSNGFNGEIDPQRFRAALRGSMPGKEGCLPTNDSSHVASPSSMSRASSQDQGDMIMKMSHMQQHQNPQSPAQQLQEQQHLHHMASQNQQDNTCIGTESNNMISYQTSDQVLNGKKRKQTSSSGLANNIGTGNTTANSLNSAPSTPSTHTPGDMSMSGNFNHSNSIPKNLVMYGSDGASGLASPSNQLIDIDHFADGSMEDNVDSFFSPDDNQKDVFL